MSQEVDIAYLLDRVHDERSFVVFVEALAEDWNKAADQEGETPSSPYGPRARGWENWTVGAFLASAASWAADSRAGMESYAVPSNPWKRLADILYAARIYE